MRVVFFGTPEVAVPSLRALLATDDVEVVAVVTNPDRPRGRSRTPRPSPVKQVANEAGVTVFQPAHGRDVADQLSAVAPHVCAVVAYGSLLPTTVLEVPDHGFVNLHFSLLPRWRGAAPVQHAVMARDELTGVTTFVLDDGMDTGPVLEQVTTPIGPTETSGDLLDRLAVDGARVLVDSLRALVAGAEPTPQPDGGATLAPKITPDDVAIDFHRSAGDVAALVRGAAPRPGAHTTWHGDRFKVLDAVEVDHVAGREAAQLLADLHANGVATPSGTIVHADRDGVVVACGSGVMCATRVQPAGKAAMDAGSFVNGHQPGPGDRFGT